VAQLNAQHASVVTPQVCELVQQAGVDVILLQESYVVRRSVVGYERHTVHCTQGADITPAAAIVVLNKNYRAVTINSLMTSHPVVVALHTVGGPLYLVSMYFQYREPVDPYLNHLREIMRCLRGKRVMVGIDANARSSMGHSDRTCGWSSASEDFILEQGLLVLNKRSPFLTFTSTSDDSNIDVSLFTASL
jgi:hypothetical protein